METKFNFKSAICTTREQSERLLSLGLKKETADIVHFFSQSLAQDWTIVPLADGETAKYIQGLEIPAWSLHRLIEMMPSKIEFPLVGMPKDFHFEIHNGLVRYYNGYVCCVMEGGGYYKGIIDCIEWLIKEGYFNKKYLV